MKNSLIVLMGLLVLCIAGTISLRQAGAQEAEAPVLVAEFRDVDTVYANSETAEAMGFGFGGALLSGTDNPPMKYYFGLDQWFYPDQLPAFVDYDRTHPDFVTIVDEWLSDGEGGIIALAYPVKSANNDSLWIANKKAGYFEIELDGIHTPPDLLGCTIDFVRLLVNKIEFVAGTSHINYDVTWQFWGGKPASLDGGGQRSDVDDFLVFANPIEKSTTLSSGTDHFNVFIFYGTTIDKTTFEATLNGVPFNSFNPAPGTRETVTIPLISGRNKLLVKASGVRTDGRSATDTDSLTFVVK